MWIIMTRLVPIEVPVPKLSIHWSVPWPRSWEPRKPREQITRRQWRTYGYHKLGLDYDEHEGIPPEIKETPFGQSFGREPDWKGARKILFKGHEVRVFPHEFNSISTESMRLLITEGVYTLRLQSGIASDETIDAELVGEQKVIYEEALVAGCDHAQAMMVCFGIDPTVPDAEFPPVGWYKCKAEYAEHFCRDWEMDREDRKVPVGAGSRTRRKTK